MWDQRTGFLWENRQRPHATKPFRLPELSKWHSSSLWHKQDDRIKIQRWDGRERHLKIRWSQTQDVLHSLWEPANDVSKNRITIRSHFTGTWCLQTCSNKWSPHEVKQHTNWLFRTSPPNHSRQQNIIQCFDGKHFIQNDGTHCLPFDHFERRDWQLQREILEDDDWGDEER